MEFGIFVNGFIPGPAAHDRASEHLALRREMEIAIKADKHNWKFVWFGEHHSLTEYSHMSAPEVVMGYVAARTERIHLGTGINSLSPRKEHPVRFAERAAMLDHITEGRFEWGTGRGAGSHELKSFNIMDTDSTKPEWDEVSREIVRMWEQHDYSFQGQHFTVPTPHNILPKPYGHSHPPIWMACGNPPSFAKAGSLGIGAIAFNFEPIYNLKGRIEAYKEAAENPVEILGDYQNNNVMMTNAVVCLNDRKRAREIALSAGNAYIVTLVNLYHDTMPKSADGITWPEPPINLGAFGGEELLDELIAGGYLLCGTPDEVCEQVEAYQRVGCDQLVFGLAGGMTFEEHLEMVELFGDRVIPEFDRNPEISTEVYRRGAGAPKYPPFNGPVDPDLKHSVLPLSAILPVQD
ncbi:LLM class flavin-dependent oxidoreductase [Streptacidiphilus jiangxiensis]|uniref:Flavin-dependent oxidoreductase, luciferase family (Includes alkanesulfonate monooxygenase SsuD and methylene tetrahydromethanopterin reductase) n=1 Tax=Streptacidiphilus jiangxiensis TaxID=235985 RepID=A0A1H7TQE6_STRJI|nr:LLM class flavin-dependent oxidoreductase [Streptacidiphilus jiangxiensis]SEL86908.1 Flavin-dependent oxidoreductase, luciferase family (includes alkanesulfonate monooxygenase SsuD and methylene tetrahydromethanopterin reductase) [Streptacidiphilus jiangxiensis]